MGVVTVPGPFTGRSYRIQITGDTPTVDERMEIDAFVNQEDTRRAKEYEARFGTQLTTEGEGLFNYLGEIPKGIARGAVGAVETGALGIASLLPERFEAPTREFIRGTAYGLKPQADVGLEETVGGTFGEALGSFIPLAASTLLPGGQFIAPTLAAGLGAGEASERARAAGATEAERAAATLAGAPVGLAELLPIKFISILGRPTTGAIADRIARAAATGGVEGAQEAAATIAQNLIAQGVYNPEQGAFTDTGEALGYGAGVGAFVQALLDLALPRQRGGTAGGTAGGAAEGVAPPLDPATLQTQLEMPLTPSTRPGFVEGTEQGELFLPTAPSVPPTPPAVPPATPPLDPATLQTQLELGLTPSTRPGFVEDAEQGELFLPTAPEAQPVIPRYNALRAAGFSDEQVRAMTPEQRDAALAPTPEAAPAPETAPEAAPAPEVTPEAVVERQMALPKAQKEELLTALNTDTDGLIDMMLENPAAVDAEIGRIEATAAPAPAPFDKDAALTRLSELGVPKGAAVYQRTKNDKITTQDAFDAALRDFGGKTKSAPVRSNIDAYFAPPAPTPTPPLPGPTAAFQGPDRPVTRQYIPSSRVRVDPVTLQATSRPFFRPGDEQLVEPLPETPAVAEDGRPISTGPTQAELAQQELIAGAQADAVLATKHNQWLAQQDVEGLADVAADYSVPDALVAEDTTTSTDKQKIAALLDKGDLDKKGMAPAKHAKTYFSRFKRPVDALDWIAADQNLFAGRTKKEVEEALEAEQGTLPAGDETISPAERAFTRGMSRNNANQAAKWVEENLSPAANLQFRNLQRFYRKSAKAKVPNRVSSASLTATSAFGANRQTNVQEQAALEEQIGQWAAETAAQQQAEKLAGALARATSLKGLEQVATAATAARTPMRRPPGMRKLSPAEEARQEQDQLDAIVDLIMATRKDRLPKDVLNRINEAVADLDVPLHPAVANALLNGDLNMAMRMASFYAPNPMFAKLARRLTPFTRGVELSIQRNLRNAYGQQTLGGFSPSTNTLYLDADFGMTFQTLLHEMLHVATAAQLRNPSNPITKRLKSIFDTARPLLKDNNAAFSLDEFVVEAMTNPKFQSELAMLHPRGSKFSVWDRFSNVIANIVRRLLGRPTKPVESALDEVSYLVDNILAPVPAARSGGMLYRLNTPAGAQRLLDGVAAASGAFPKPTQEFANRFGDEASRVLSGANDTGKRIVLGLMGMQPVRDIAEHYGIVGAKDLENAVRQMDSASIKADNEVDAVLVEMADWLKRNPSLKTTFDKVVTRSTLNQVDPGMARNKAEKRYGGDPNKLATYNNMQADWQRLGNEGRALYNLMRQTYAKQYERLKDALYAKVDFALSDNPELASEIKKSIYTKFFDLNKIEPYFPLVRKGDYWLEYAAFNPETNTTEPVKEAFESPRARDRAVRELASVQGVVKNPDGTPAVQVYNSMDFVERGRTADSLFVRDTLNIIKQNLAATNTDPAVVADIQQDITRMFIEAMPETSFAKSLQRRKGTAGFIEDSFEAFKMKAYNLGRQGVRYAYSNKVRSVANSIRDQATNTADQNKLAVIQELLDRAEFAVNPPNDAWNRFVQNANRVAFAFTIGGNVSSAVVNLSSVPMVVYPYLAGKYGYRDTTVALSDAYKLYTNSGFKRELALPVDFMGRETTEVRSMPSLDNYYVLNNDGNYVIRDGTPDALRPMLEELKPLVDLASKNGQLNRSIYYDSIGAEEVGRARTALDKVNALSGAMFHNVERANRQVSLIAAYKLELDRLNNRPTAAERALTPEGRRVRAAEQAIYMATETNGGATLATAPRLSQKGILRAALMFKNYGLTMFYLQAKLAKTLVDNAFPGNDPARIAQRNAAFKQLAGIQLSAFALAGAFGTPIFGMASMVWDAFLGDDEEDAEMITRRYLGEGLSKGMLTAALGLDISSRIGLTGLLISSNRYNTDPSAEESIVAALGGPAWSTVSQIRNGVGEIYRAMSGGEGDMQRGIENMLPAAIRNPLKSLRYMGDEASAETRRGDIIVGDLSGGDLVGQALGFRPNEVSLQQDLNQMKVRISRNVAEKRSSLSRRYYIALRAGDIEGAREILDDIRRFNEGVRDRFPDAVIDRDYLDRSIKGHQRTSSQMARGVSINPAVREGLLDLEAQYDQGIQLF